MAYITRFAADFLRTLYTRVHHHNAADFTAIIALYVYYTYIARGGGSIILIFVLPVQRNSLAGYAEAATAVFDLTNGYIWIREAAFAAEVKIKNRERCIIYSLLLSDA